MSTHKFIAFLSYCHADATKACELHTAIERFRIPGKLRKRLGLTSAHVRLFRDQDELAASSDLGATLKQHLEDSSALVVLASPASARSQWVNTEIDYFVGLGRASRIFVVSLLEDPGALPPSLSSSSGGAREPLPEPFTLNWSKGGESTKTIVMRLLAGILGVDYEEFRQRAAAAARVRGVVAGALALVVVAGASYGSGLLASVRETALIDQSRRLAQMSHEQVALGDSLMGVKLALLALPDDPQKPNRPLVGEAELALKVALEGWRPILASTQFEAPVTAIAPMPDGKATYVGLKDGSIWRLSAEQSAPQKFGALNGEIYRMEISSDGAVLVAAASRTSLGAWKLDGGQKLLEQVINEYADSGIYQWALSADGRYLAVHASDIGRSIKVFDVFGNKLRGTIESPTRKGFPACVFVDGNRLGSAWVDEKSPLILHRLDTLTQISARYLDLQLNGCKLHTPTGQVALHTFDGEVVVIGRKDGFRTDTVLRGHGKDSRIQDVAFDRRGAYLASTAVDRRLVVWNLVSGKKVTEAALPLPAGSLMLGLDAKHAIVTDKKEKVWILPLQETEPALLPLPVKSGIVSLLDGGLAVAFAYGDKGLIVQQLEENALELPGHGSRVRSVAFTHDGNRLLTAADDNAARLWDAQSGVQIGSDMLHREWVLNAEFSRDGRKVVTCSTDGSARVWDGLTGAPLSGPLNTGIQSNVEHCHFSADATRLITTDEVTRVWDVASGQCLAAFPIKGTVDIGCKSSYPRQDNDRQTVAEANFDTDSLNIVIAYQNGLVAVHDATTFARTATGKHGDYVSSIRFCAKDNQLLSSSIDGTAVIWRLPAMQMVETFNVGSEARVAEFDRECRRVVVTSDQQGTTVWQVGRNGQPRAMGGKEEIMTKAAFSPDGKSVLLSQSNSTANYAMLVDAGTGTELKQFRLPSSNVSEAAFSPRGDQIAAGGSNGKVFLWRLATSDNATVEQARAFAKNLPLSEAQRARFLLD